MPRKSLKATEQNADGEWKESNLSRPDPEPGGSAPNGCEENGGNPDSPRTEPDGTGMPAEIVDPEPDPNASRPPPRTGTEEPEFREYRPGLQAEGAQDQPAPHTGSEESEVEGTHASDTGTESPSDGFGTAFLHTNTDTGENSQRRSPTLDADRQTDFENPAVAPGDADAPHTDPALISDEVDGTQNPGADADNPPVSHTDPEPPADEAAHTPPSDENPDEPSISRTDSGETPRPGAEEAEAGPKIRRPAAKSRSGENKLDPTQPGADPQAQSRSGETKTANAESARRRSREASIISIDGRRSVETDADKLKSDLIDLAESQKGKRILSGTIQGVERPADNPNISFAVIYHGAFKVIIPAAECVKPPDDFRDRSPADVMHYLVTKRLGAEIDYVVKGVDAKAGVAAASRLEAMALKRKDYSSDSTGTATICSTRASPPRPASSR
jgi:hypothetical protein